MAFRLPRLPRSASITNGNLPSLEFQRWWQSVVETLEAQETAQDAIIADLADQLAQIRAARAAAGLIIVGPSSGTVEAETNGTVVAGELPAIFEFTLEEDGVEVSSDVVWGAVLSSGTATIAIAAGQLTLSALSSTDAKIIVSATYNGVVRKLVLRIVKRIASPDINTGTGGTSAADNSFNAFTDTTYIAVTDSLNITTGSGGGVELSAPLNLKVDGGAPVGTYSATLRWQQDIGGTWTDVGTEHVTGDCTAEPDGLVIPASATANETLTLTASTSYRFRLAAKANEGDGLARYLTGTASASGS